MSEAPVRTDLNEVPRGILFIDALARFDEATEEYFGAKFGRNNLEPVREIAEIEMRAILNLSDDELEMIGDDWKSYLSKNTLNYRNTTVGLSHLVKSVSGFDLIDPNHLVAYRKEPDEADSEGERLLLTLYFVDDDFLLKKGTLQIGEFENPTISEMMNRKFEEKVSPKEAKRVIFSIEAVTKRMSQATGERLEGRRII